MINNPYKLVKIYADEHENLLILPTGDHKMYGAIGIGIVNQLLNPFTDDSLEIALQSALDLCNTINPDQTNGTTTLELHLGVKRYSTAVKNRKLIFFEWEKKDGFTVTPSDKEKGAGFNISESKSIKLGESYKDGELAQAIRKALAESTTF